MYDIAIIGGGPAGLAAGIYSARGGTKCVLIEEMFLGGQMTRTEKIDNYPGFDDGIDGFTAATKLENQAKRFGLEIVSKQVVSVSLTGETKHIVCDDGEIDAKAVIIATGASPRKLGIDNEESYVGAGISYCATCDGAFFKGKTVAVVGGGDTALSDAIYLSKLAKKVYLVHRRDEFRGAKVLQDAVHARENIELVLSCLPQKLIGDKNITALEVKNVNSGEVRTLEAEGIFAAVGIEPRTELFNGALNLTAARSIVTNSRMETNIQGVYAAGDVRDTQLRQVVTALADGAIAATSAIEYLR